MSFLELKNLHKSFDSKLVLSGLNLSLDKGQSLALLGASGSGKSVTIKCLLGLLQPDQGQMFFDGQELQGKTFDDLYHRSGMLFQASALFDSLKIWENIAFRELYSGQDKKLLRSKAITALNSVGLHEKVANLYPSDLSGGMQKRAALARAIVHRPEILFFDEPTTGLDPITSEIINELMLSCIQSVGASAITITHDLACARKIATHAALLYHGTIVWQGTIKELDQSQNPYVVQFLKGSIEGPIQIGQG